MSVVIPVCIPTELIARALVWAPVEQEKHDGVAAK
jgi:hypothetical protein